MGFFLGVLDMQKSDISSARNVLPRSGWDVSGICGRPFTSSDLEALIALGTGDRFFAWERQYQTRDYFETLLRFRLSHYERYSFGVHGIWRKDQLIGQCGLQVLDEGQDQVEFAIFLGSAFTGQGLGELLSRYLIRRCVSCGMKSLFGVARADNMGATGLMRKIGGVALRTITHYNREAVVFKVDLANEKEGPCQLAS
jgi:RimJ/RimL family protein N-acetyltransferase